MVISVDEVALEIEYIGKAAGESGAEIDSGAAKDTEMARRLWERSEQLTNTHFGLSVPA